jgi:hypothetical protein
MQHMVRQTSVSEARKPIAKGAVTAPRLSSAGFLGLGFTVQALDVSQHGGSYR